MTQRRQLMKAGASLAGLLATMSLLPRAALAQAGWNKAAFDAKSLDEVAKALGVAKPVESKELDLAGPRHRRERRRGAGGVRARRCRVSSACCC